MLDDVVGLKATMNSNVVRRPAGCARCASTVSVSQEEGDEDQYAVIRALGYKVGRYLLRRAAEPANPYARQDITTKVHELDETDHDEVASDMRTSHRFSPWSSPWCTSVAIREILNHIWQVFLG